MPPLISLSPLMLDQSFPRDEGELIIVGIALGELQHSIMTGAVELLITEYLQDIMKDFTCGTGDRPYALLNEIFGLLDQWLLQPNSRVIKLNVQEVTEYSRHPAPASCTNDGNTEFWADELGRLYKLHDERTERGEFFIGIACESGFAGGAVGSYRDGEGKGFPLVGPEDIPLLADSYHWVIDESIHRSRISVTNAKKNITILGATSVQSASRGSHIKVSFPGHRPWPLDSNDDPVPDAYLKELIPITGYSLLVIKYVMQNGHFPDSRHRLIEYIEQ